MKAYVLMLALGAGLLPSQLLADSPSGGAQMHAAKVVGITIISPWLRATPKGAPVAGGYVTIRNAGGMPDRLIGASLPMAAKGEVHSMSMDNGVMHMRRLDDGLAIAPGQTITLAPGGDHLMFIKPTAPLKVGDKVTGSLTFARMGTIPVTFAVAGMAARTAPGTPEKAPSGHGGMPGMDMH